MDDLGENTMVLSTLRTLNNFICQRVEAAPGLDSPAYGAGSLQRQYQHSMQLEERAEQIRSKSYLLQVEREKMQMELSHKRARVELEKAASVSARNYEREVDRNQELLARIRQLEEQEAEAAEKMREQVERHRLCRQSLDAANQQLREQEDSLATASEDPFGFQPKPLAPAGWHQAGQNPVPEFQQPVEPPSMRRNRKRRKEPLTSTKASSGPSWGDLKRLTIQAEKTLESTGTSKTPENLFLAMLAHITANSKPPQTVSALKARVSELQWGLMDQEVQVKRLESEKQELQEQLDLKHSKWQEANQKIQELQASQEAKADQEEKIKGLEQKLCLQEQDATVVRTMRAELLRLPLLERELKRLREENAQLREIKDTNGLLTEELEGLRRRLGRQEKMQEELVGLELEKERLLAKLQSWERLEQTTGLNLRTPEDLSRFIVELQQRELALREKNSAISSSSRGLEKAQQQLQEEVRLVSGQLLEERRKRETHEALARRLQKRILLLTKERDGMRAILGSYDSELTQAEYSPQLTRRMREAEDMVQKVHAHSTEVEAQLSQALEELGGQKQRADMLEMELKMLKTQPGPAEPSFLFCREEVDALRLKVEELEGERSRLEQEKQGLEMQMERRALQGDYDQGRTKVLHMSSNPASLAKRRLREERDQLQEECERLRGLLHTVERGGPTPSQLEAAASLPSSKEVAELRRQVESCELKNQRLKEVFQTKIQEFRKVCYSLTGYQIDVTAESQYRLTSQYAERQTDCLVFKATGPSGSKMQLLETEFSRSVPELIELHLLRQDSIPAFLSSLTLELFSRQTTA